MVVVGFSAVFAILSFLFSSNLCYKIPTLFGISFTGFDFHFEAQRGARKDGQANETKSRRLCVCLCVNSVSTVCLCSHLTGTESTEAIFEIQLLGWFISCQGRGREHLGFKL